MKSFKRIICIILATFVFCFSGCTVNEKKKEDIKNEISNIQESVSIYYSNDDGNDLVKKEVKIPEENQSDILKFVVDKLIDSSGYDGVKSAVRNGTKCLWVAEENGNVSVNLSKEFYNDENLYDIMAVASVVKSLCSVNFVRKVNVLIEGSPIKNSSGEEMGFMSDSDFVFDADALDYDEENVVLYFSDENAEFLVPEVRRIKLPKGEVIEKLVVGELLKGPEKEDNVSVIPVGVKIISVETKDGVCFVNLSKEFITKYVGGTSAEMLTIYSVVNSLTELSGVEKVQFLIDGEKKDKFVHTVFNEPFERDISLMNN